MGIGEFGNVVQGERTIVLLGTMNWNNLNEFPNRRQVWMCGGNLQIIQCSRVGHIFRKKTPYTFPGGGANYVVTYNSNRLANVWIDDWLEFYYLINSGKCIQPWPEFLMNNCRGPKCNNKKFTNFPNPRSSKNEIG